MKAAARLAALLLLAPALAVAQQAPNRTRPPTLAAPTPLKLPSIEKRELKNGLDVWLVEVHEVPLVQVNLVIHAGSGDDPAGAPLAPVWQALHQSLATIRQNAEPPEAAA